MTDLLFVIVRIVMIIRIRKSHIVARHYGGSLSYFVVPIDDLLDLIRGLVERGVWHARHNLGERKFRTWYYCPSIVGVQVPGYLATHRICLVTEVKPRGVVVVRTAYPD